MNKWASGMASVPAVVKEAALTSGVALEMKAARAAARGLHADNSNDRLGGTFVETKVVL